MKSILRRALLGTTLLALAAGAARADLYVRNNFGENVQVSVVYQNNDGAWVAEGPWVARPCGDRVLVLKNDETVDPAHAYVFARTRTGPIVLGDRQFCLPAGQDRTWRATGPCGNVGAFQRVNGIRGGRDFVLNLNPQRSQCTD